MSRATHRATFTRLAIVAALALTSLAIAPPARATLSGCIASISPQSVGISSDTGFLVDVYNPDPSPIQWVRISSPGDQYFSFEDGSASGWSLSMDATTATFDSGSLPHGSDQGFSIQAVAGSAVTTQTWQVEASDAADGSNAIICSGDTSVSTTNNPSDIHITNVGITSIGPTTATITWDTDIASTTRVDYGLDSGYGQVGPTSSALTLTHTVTLTGLTASTGYHYMVTSTTPADGGTASSGDNTFLTALPAPTPIIVVSGGSNVPGTTIKPTPTETVPPAVQLDTSLAKPFKEPPLLSGLATDNDAVARVEYSIDGGLNWLPAATVTRQLVGGVLSPKRVAYSFTPTLQDDGNYQLLVRATDTSGNTATTSPATLIIDRLPPQLGPLVISAGPETFRPNNQGVLELLAGSQYKLSGSAVGGPTNLTLQAEAAEQLDPTRQSISLTQNPDSGLWEGIISFGASGIYQLTAKGLDGAGNQTSRPILTAAVTPAGRVLSGTDHRPVAGATLTIYCFEPASRSWQVWDGAPYGQTNPQTTSATGNYNLILPEGRYYLSVRAPGYRTFATTAFDINQAQGLALVIPLQSLAKVKFGSWSLTLPDVLSWQAQTLPPPELRPIAAAQTLAGQTLPDFKLPGLSGGAHRNLDYEGKPTVVTLLATWSPDSQEQLAALVAAQANTDVNVVPVFSQERAQQVGIYLAVSGHRLDGLVDPDGLLVPKLGVGPMPQHLFVDRTGHVKKVMLGVLSKDQLLDQLGGL